MHNFFFTLQSILDNSCNVFRVLTHGSILLRRQKCPHRLLYARLCPIVHTNLKRSSLCSILRLRDNRANIKKYHDAVGLQMVNRCTITRSTSTGVKLDICICTIQEKKAYCTQQGARRDDAGGRAAGDTALLTHDPHPAPIVDVTAAGLRPEPDGTLSALKTHLVYLCMTAHGAQHTHARTHAHSRNKTGEACNICVNH